MTATCPTCGQTLGAGVVLRQPAGLTHRQTEVLSFIRAYIAEHGVAPTYDEIGRGVGIVLRNGKTSKGGVFALVCALVERGHIRMLKGHHRAISLVSP